MKIVTLFVCVCVFFYNFRLFLPQGGKEFPSHVANSCNLLAVSLANLADISTAAALPPMCACVCVYGDNKQIKYKLIMFSQRKHTTMDSSAAPPLN